jgi:myo-inositol-1(or 4)-monophosphatase
MSADERLGSECRLQLTADLALRGGRIALEWFHRGQFSGTPDGAGLTDARLAIQETLGREIARSFRTDGLAGGGGPIGVTRPDTRYVWILDPIDGAEKFMRGLPGFSVSVGVLREGLPFAGAVYDPVARWLFTGSAGRGAWLNDRALRVRAGPVAGMSPCVVGAGGVSTGLSLCYVALGGIDVLYTPSTSLWHIAGAAPVLLEAGGALMTDAGVPIFPVTAAQASGAPMTLLAGHPSAVVPEISTDLQRAAREHSDGWG